MHHALPPSEPPDGERSRCFRLVIVGGMQLRESWYLSAIVQLQGFSSGSPTASPRRWSPKMVTTSSLVGRSEPGCGLCPALSFKDLHHPCWGGGRAELELYLPHGFVGHPLLQHSEERVLTVLAEGADCDNAGLVGRERRQLQRVGLAGSVGSGSAPGAPSRRTSGRRATRTGGPPKTSRAARAAFVFLGCPAFAPVRRLLHGGWCFACPGGSEWGSAGGQMAAVVDVEVVAAEEVPVADEIAATIRAPGLRLFGFDSLSSPLEWGCGRGARRSSVRSKVIAAAVWPLGAEVVVAAAGAGVGEPPGVLSPRRPSNVGGCSHLREWNRSSVCNGSLSASVCSLWLSGPEHFIIVI
jgi:hypothetical protein